jgi:uncharacterized membrane protein
MNEPVVLAPASSPSTLRPVRDRLDAVDVLRGFVMVVMALDHTRDFVHAGAVHGLDPLDLTTTYPLLYLTRWITHFCAPVFVFLAGTGAFLSTTRGKSRRELSWFLVTRGAWLVVLELTFVRWAGWTFAFDVGNFAAAVIWALGWSMIVLAALIHLPLWATTVIGVLMIVGHNATDAITPAAWGSLGWLWKILHARGAVEFAPGHFLRIGYPLIPWIGVMAAGYGFGALLLRDVAARRSVIFRLGLALTLAFLVIRFSNVYGDPRPWRPQATPALTAMSFLDCVKYPPSLCYLLMTLGPALMLLAWLDRPTPRALRPLLVFGRVPMFYYLLHLPLIHGLAVAIEYVRFGAAPWLFGDPFGAHPKPHAEAGLPLFAVYVVWLIVLMVLYPVCAWFAELKRRNRSAWLSYF